MSLFNAFLFSVVKLFDLKGTQSQAYQAKCLHLNIPLDAIRFSCYRRPVKQSLDNLE